VKLTIKKYNVREIVFGEESKFDEGILCVCKKDLVEKAVKGIEGFEIEVRKAAPGEKTRIVHVMDAIKPSYKKGGGAFSGWRDINREAGTGTTSQLEGIALLQTCEFPGIQEGIIDMFGSGARFSRFSKMLNLVLSMQLKDASMKKSDFEIKAKEIILNAAEYLAGLTYGKQEDAKTLYELAEPLQKPQIGYAYYIQAQGHLRNVFFHGKAFTQDAPVFVHPNEILDGALVSSNFIIACQKNPTYFHQENPVILELYGQDGKDISFRGVIISTESSTLEEKKQNAQAIAAIALEKGLDGIVISQEGGGHADVDLMMCVDACEESGIKTVVLTNEIAGVNGDQPPLVSFSNRADAIVSNGNNDAMVQLDAMSDAIGGENVLNGKYGARDAFQTSLGILYTATNQLGANLMATAEY
jgi:glycine reductase